MIQLLRALCKSSRGFLCAFFALGFLLGLAGMDIIVKLIDLYMRFF
jgi:hypothetical protein